MAYNVSNAFREQCYKGSSLYKCRLIIGGNIVPTSQLASITISSPIIDSSSQTFYIGTFVSQKLTIQFKNLNGIEIASGTNVELYISQYVNDEWVEVPIGKYLIDESPENYYKSSQIECLDYAIKFATNLDYSPAFVDNKITIDNLLQWICNHYGVTLGNYPNTNGNVEIGTYDSTVSGKRWISYIAEIKGCNAKMDRLGRLTLVPLKSSPVVTINALKSKSWELGEKYEIKKVIFFDAIRNYTYGDDTGNILYLRQDNPFIINTNIVQNLYNAVKDFVCWSLKCENYGDISLDSWDRIAYTLGNSTYYTLNNNTITYAMTIMSKVETKIPTKQQEVTTNVVEGNNEQRIRRLKTEINNIDNTITLQAQQIETNTTNIATNTSNISTANTNINNINDELSNPTNTLTGQYFDIDNALDEPLVDFSMEGQTEQDSTTQGKNLLNNTFRQGSESSTTVNNYIFSSKASLLETGTYTFSNDLDSSYQYAIFGTRSNYPNSETKTYNSGWKTGNTTFTISEKLYIGVLIRKNNLSNLSPTDVSNNKFQIEQGSSATSFEPFVPNSPSPDYPMDIHCVSGDNTIEICGKNLCNGTEVGAFDRNGLKTTGTNLINKNMIRVKPSTTYKISNDGSGMGVNILSYQSDKTYIGTSPYQFYESFTTSSNTYYINFWRANNLGDNPKIQLELGNQATTYEAYTGNSQLISLGDIELLKIGNYKDYIYRQDNRWYLHKEIGKVVLDGSEDWSKSSNTSVDRFLRSSTIPKATQGISNYFKVVTTLDTIIGTFYFNERQQVVNYSTYGTTTLATFKTWVSTYKPIIYYVLAEPTDTEITGTLLEQLNRLMTLPLYKNMTHITIEPNDLTPIMNIEYVRDTAINSQFVRQPQLNNYYTRTETTAQIQIGNASIKQDVTEIQTTLDNNGNAISSLSSQVQNLQTSTSQQINVINQTLENGVEKLTNSLVTIDINGINTSKDNETFNTQITNKTFEVKDGDNRMGFMGFDTDKQKMLVEFPEMQTQKLTNAYHTTEKITEDGLKWSADFYVGDDN